MEKCLYFVLYNYFLGLFHRAICMSGVVLNPWAVAENLKEKTIAIANDLGCPVNDSLVMIDCMRNRPADHIISISKKFWVVIYYSWSRHRKNSLLLIYLFFQHWRDRFPLVVFAPIIEQPSENAFISDLPMNIIKEKGGSDVPVIISFVKDEGLCGGSGKVILI